MDCEGISLSITCFVAR